MKTKPNQQKINKQIKNHSRTECPKVMGQYQTNSLTYV